MTTSSSIEHLRHSLAHLLAAAVLELYPDAKRAIGPAIENGFYYDFEFSEPVSNDDLSKIEKKMREILKTWDDFSHREVSADEAREMFAGNPYKLELIDEIVAKPARLNDSSRSGGGEKITIYTAGAYDDLCRGGHVESAKEIDPKAFKLTHVAGAYWRGDEKNAQLTRIYGVAFATKEELDAHLAMLEEAKKRDHRKLGKELGLFTLTDEVGPGLPLFYPKGAQLRRTVEDFIAGLQEKRGYNQIWVPHITKSRLYEISGHLDKYDTMFPPMELKDEAVYYLKPMNCPHFMMLYKSVPHSYRELPVRWTATSTVYRQEKSGELSGLTRVRSLTQDDCHVFARPDQIQQEINLMLDMIEEVYKAFGFHDFWVSISTRNLNDVEKYIGDPDVWDTAELTLKGLIKNRGWKHEIVPGEAAFYGPKLDFIFKDVLGRSWQLSTIQLDMNLPQRFELEYTDSDGAKKQPVVIHRAILGSTERFLGIMIEHFGGAFPVWLAPVQVAVLPISDKFNEYANTVIENCKLKIENVRIEIDAQSESIGKKIRNAELQKIPYLLIIGEKELEAGTVAVRQRGKGDLGQMNLADFLKQLQQEIARKS